MKSIFNEKIVKKWYLWVRKQCTDILFTVKSQHLQLLFMNSNHKPPETHAKKKKGKSWLWDVYVDPNVLIIYNISAVWIGLKMRLCFLLLFFFFGARVLPQQWLLFMYCTWIVAVTFDQSFMNTASVHCLWTYKFHFLSIFSLKIGPKVLCTHLKIILLQCFQFSVSVK